MKATLKNKLTGDTIQVTSTTTHPDSSYGQAVWVNEDNTAISVVGMPNPLYEVTSATIDDRETLGQFLRYCRIGQGISIRGLAEKAGLTPSTIQNVENGAFTPRLDIILKITAALGKDLRIE